MDLEKIITISLTFSNNVKSLKIRKYIHVTYPGVKFHENSRYNYTSYSICSSRRLSVSRVLYYLQSPSTQRCYPTNKQTNRNNPPHKSEASHSEWSSLDEKSNSSNLHYTRTKGADPAKQSQFFSFADFCPFRFEIRAKILTAIPRNGSGY